MPVDFRTTFFLANRRKPVYYGGMGNKDQNPAAGKNENDRPRQVPPALCAALDFRLFPVNMNVLPWVADTLAEACFTHALVSWGGSFPLSEEKRLCADHAYPEEVVSGFISRLRKNGITCLTLLPTLTGLAGLLSCAGYSYLSHAGKSGDGIDPAGTGARALMEGIIEDICGLTIDVPVILDIRGWKGYENRKALWHSYILPLTERAKSVSGGAGWYLDSPPTGKDIPDSTQQPAYLFTDGSEIQFGSDFKSAFPFLVIRTGSSLTFSERPAAPPPEPGRSKPPKSGLYETGTGICLAQEKDFLNPLGAELCPPIFNLGELLRAIEFFTGKQGPGAGARIAHQKATMDKLAAGTRKVRDILFKAKEIILLSQKEPFYGARLRPSAEKLLGESERGILTLKEDGQKLKKGAAFLLEGESFSLVLNSAVQALEEEQGTLTFRLGQL